MPEARAISLTPVVSGRLAATELNVIEAVKAGSPFRTTISLEAPVALAAVRAAAAEKREFSNFCEVALLEYAGQHGTPSPETVEMIGKVSDLLSRKPGARAALAAALVKIERSRAA